VTITNIKMKAKGYKMTDDAKANIVNIISSGTTPELRSKYNGRLIDNLLQWSSDEMNTRLPLDASGDQLITLHKSDFENAIKRFATARPPSKTVIAGGREVENQLASWDLSQYSELFARAGYRQLFDLLALNNESAIRALGISKDADVKRAMSLVKRMEQQHREISQSMDALYVDPECMSMQAWLEKRELSEFVKAFDKHRVDFEILGDITYEDIKEMGVLEVGSRRKIFRAIEKWREERDFKKAEAIRSMMANKASLMDEEQQRIEALKRGMSMSGGMVR